jgi:putative ABC transport system permease protein
MTLILTLASRNLFHDRVRLVATVVGIVFSIVLVTVQLGVFLSFERMVTTMIDHAQADFWIVPAETKSFEGSSLLAGRERLQALSVNGVTAAVPVVVGYASWRKPDGGASTPVFVVGTPETTAGLQPWNLVEGNLRDLSIPEGVAVDRSYFDELGIAQIGERAEIDNQKARVVVLTRGIRSFTTMPDVFTSIERARAYLGVPSDEANYFMVRLSPNVDAEAVRAQLARRLSDAEVLTPEQFRRRTFGCSTPAPEPRSSAAPFSASSSARSSSRKRSIPAPRTISRSLPRCAPLARRGLISSRSFSARRSSAPSLVSPLRPVST